MNRKKHTRAFYAPTRLPLRSLSAFAGLSVAALCIAQGGCQKPATAAAPPPKPPEVTVAAVVERTVTDQDEFTGRTEAVQSVEVRSRVRGYLDAVQYREGDEVKAGTPLFQIDPRTFDAELKNAEGQKAQWIAKRDKAKADVERYQRLVPTGAASAQDLDKAEAELGEAIAAIQSADAEIDRAKLDVEFAKITAPIDGQVGQALITKGNLVQSGSGSDALLTTIVSLDPIYVYFGVNERTLLRLRDRYRTQKTDGGTTIPTVSELKIPVLLGLSNETGYPHQGVIDFADNKVDPSTGTIRVRAVFDNKDRSFKPGLFSRVRIPIGQPYQAVLVSQTALGTDQGQKYVLVVDDKGVVERRFVKPGPLQDDGLMVILEGLRPGESIVVNGLQRARPGKPVTPLRGEMPVIGASAVKAHAPQTTQPTGH